MTEDEKKSWLWRLVALIGLCISLITLWLNWHR